MTLLEEIFVEADKPEADDIDNNNNSTGNAFLDPKRLLETLLRNFNPQIVAKLNGTTPIDLNTNLTSDDTIFQDILENEDSSLSDTKNESDPVGGNDNDKSGFKYDFHEGDLYVIVSGISLCVFLILVYTICKAVASLKTSMNDARGDSVPVENQNSSQQNPRNPGNNENSSASRNQRSFIESGFRNIQSATLRSNRSQDLPPPYDEEEFSSPQINPDAATGSQNGSSPEIGAGEVSPPPYHVAIKMISQERQELENQDRISYTSGDETDGKFVSISMIV